MGVGLDGTHPIPGEHLRHHTLQDLAVGKHVADARWGPQVVLEDVKIALAVADEVDARNVRVDAPREGDADQVAAETLRGQDDVGGDGTVLQDLTAVVDVLQEEVEGLDALL